MPMDDSSRPNKGAWYTPDMLPDSISIDYWNYVSTLNNLYKYTKVILLSSDATNTSRTINREKPGRVREERGYCSRRD